MFQRCPNCEFAPFMKDCKVCNDTKIIDTITGKPPESQAQIDAKIEEFKKAMTVDPTPKQPQVFTGTCGPTTTIMGVPYQIVYKPNKKYLCIQKVAKCNVGDIVEINTEVHKLTRRESKLKAVYHLWSDANTVIHNSSSFVEYKDGDRIGIMNVGVDNIRVKLQNGKYYYGLIKKTTDAPNNSTYYYMEWQDSKRPYQDLGQLDYYHELVVKCRGYKDLLVSSLEALREQLNILALLPDITGKSQTKTTSKDSGVTSTAVYISQAIHDAIYSETMPWPISLGRPKICMESGKVDLNMTRPEKPQNAKFGCQIMLGTRGNDSLDAFAYALYANDWVNNQCPAFKAVKLEFNDKAGDKIVNESKPKGDSGPKGMPGTEGFRTEEIKDFGIKGGKIFRIVDDKYEGIIIDFNRPDKSCQVYSKSKDKIDIKIEIPTASDKNPVIDLTKYDVIVPGRRMGNTTRLTDLAIQFLFKGYTVMLMDYCFQVRNANTDIESRIRTRLEQEHGILASDLIWSKIVSHSSQPSNGKLTIRLKKCTDK